MRKLIFLCLLTICCGMARGQTVEDILAALPPATKAERVRYWFDDDLSSLSTLQQLQGEQQIDAASLIEGLHTLHFQIEDDHGALCSPRSEVFLKFNHVTETGDVQAKNLLYWFDDAADNAVSLPMTAGVQQIDASALVEGLHTLHYQVVCSDGSLTSAYSSVFLKMDFEMVQVKAQRLHFWFDDDLSTLREQPVTNGTQLLEVDGLITGLHTLHYQLTDETGKLTSPRSAVFVKMPERTVPEGENRITQYMYWTNDYSQDNVKVVLPQPASPYQLLTLLPTVTAPIRSSVFHFEVTDGQPTIYAKNDIHVRFFDAAGYWADDARSFIDYAVSEALDDVTELLTTQTFERPVENGIKWFSLQAEKGDTIAFRSSQATSLQVFSPTGQEVYAASADKSVKFGGCHTWEDGTYYVAVHDVTGTRQNVTLDYMHMDRYDVVAQDVYTVGNGGASTITFQGNGFDELESVTLEMNGFTIQADSIGHESNVSTSVRFDFTNVALGQYAATFSFKEGTKVVDKCLTLEEAIPIVIGETMQFDKQYLITRNNEYVIRLRNEGNATAYDVPVVIGIFTPQHSQLNRVFIEGHDYYNQWKRMLPHVFTPALEDSLQNLYSSEGLKPLFVKFSDVDYISGHPAMHRAMMYVTLRPNTTETFKVGINANGSAHVYVWAPEEWNTQASAFFSDKRIRKTAIHDTRCNVAKKLNSMCEENAMMRELGMDPAYPGIDCDNMVPPPNCLPPPGGSSTPVNSFDPNDIYGYTAESGSRFMTDKVQQVNYRIEFENDTTFATASAHVVEIKDTLNAKQFDLNSYAPTGIKIGDRTEMLDGKPQFVRTIDMRPQINALAQVEGFYDKLKGIITYRFTSIDPMTMEPTDDVMQGFLPVNVDGTSGIGEVSYNVNLLKAFDDGTQISNRASIVFDTNEAILTPVWTNTIDAVCPEGRVTEAVLANDSTATIRCEGSDARSGVWKYEVYVQYGSGELWEKAGECTADSAEVSFRVYDGMDYGFCALAVDSAGNVEVKEMAREASLGTYLNGDANADGTVDIEDVVNAMRYFLGKTDVIYLKAADITGDGQIDIEDVVGIGRIFLTQPSTAAKSPIKRQRLRESLQP